MRLFSYFSTFVACISLSLTLGVESARANDLIDLINDPIGTVTNVATEPLGEVGEWLKNPYVSVSIDGNKLTIGPQTLTVQSDGKVRINISGQNDSAFVKFGGVTVQTGKLRQRLAQAGCVAETGDIMGCAPDVVAKVAGQLAQEAATDKVTPQNAPSSTYDTLEQVDNNSLTPLGNSNEMFLPIPMVRYAQVCTTPFGFVPMMNATPIGAPCIAVFPSGQRFPGIAQ